ncbi:50S ribosomal protein L35 [Salinispira pacifica]|uniref:Large ribosomal subunit protein bL35 n=1 Tax=Salinispira pacifica TaxID=1307761 RepID=V5WGA6_9SPIO|nr:50S ribosomal protein L35 [Salinispira pacifica]AHC14650.1 LSU ribosomal protein L35p [Salinispira pacifica]
MPKMKTRRSAAKRYKVTGSGKVRYKKQGLRHILTKKSTKRKRKLRKAGILSPAENDRIRKILPYG